MPLGFNATNTLSTTVTTVNGNPVTYSGANNPWYNQYSGLLHSFGETVYAFAYDDEVGENSSIKILFIRLKIPAVVYR